ncbi:MAG TPA: ABC transporter permease [Terriglobales bacterium]|nr:ABC transporter permease [Terriglobales bacterium]
MPLAQLQQAARALRRFPLRSTLVVLCGGLSSAAVIVAINFTLAGRHQLDVQLENMGANLLTVAPQLNRSVGGRARTGTIVTTLRPSDERALRRALPGIALSAGVASGTFLVKAGDLSKNGASVVGVGSDYFTLRRWPTVAGPGLGPRDQLSAARVAVLGAAAARDLFPAGVTIGARLRINRIPFRVVGLLEERGQRLDAVNEDEQIFIPLSTAMRRVMNVDYYSQLVLGMGSTGGRAAVTQGALSLLRARHHILPSLPDDVQILDQQSVIGAQVAASARLLQVVIAGGLGGLLVAALATLALNWLAVATRRREIGTRRALGASANAIFVQFLLESILLTSGAALAAAACSLAFFNDARVLLAVLAIFALVNLTFATLPARRAARLDPIRALSGLA